MKSARSSSCCLTRSVCQCKWSVLPRPRPLQPTPAPQQRHPPPRPPFKAPSFGKEPPSCPWELTCRATCRVTPPITVAASQTWLANRLKTARLTSGQATQKVFTICKKGPMRRCSCALSSAQTPTGVTAFGASSPPNIRFPWTGRPDKCCWAWVATRFALATCT